MEAVLIQPNSKADMRLLMNFSKRMGALTKIVAKEKIEEYEDAALLALMAEARKTPSVSEEEVMRILRQ